MAHSLKLLAALSLATSLCGAAMAADHFTDVPLAPGDAGPWTVQSQGNAICVVKLTSRKEGPSGYGLQAPASCGASLPAGVSGWTPTANGMALTDSGGQILVSFERWSHSLLVSPKDSGFDLQLQRGGPTP